MMRGLLGLLENAWKHKERQRTGEGLADMTLNEMGYPESPNLPATGKFASEGPLEDPMAPFLGKGSAARNYPVVRGPGSGATLAGSTEDALQRRAEFEQRGPAREALANQYRQGLEGDNSEFSGVQGNLLRGFAAANRGPRREADPEEMVMKTLAMYPGTMVPGSNEEQAFRLSLARRLRGAYRNMSPAEIEVYRRAFLANANKDIPAALGMLPK